MALTLGGVSTLERLEERLDEIAFDQEKRASLQNSAAKLLHMGSQDYRGVN